jgi:hypothetical protein
MPVRPQSWGRAPEMVRGDEVGYMPTEMTRDEAIAALRPLLPVLRERFGVRRLSIFGSVARDEATAASDLDLVAEFDGPATFRRFMGAKFLIEDTLGVRVDLATPKALKSRMRQNVEREAVDVA